ncbi:MAG: GNAT family N-acetyltransferase [Treponema sp.]|jgi:GNAT superfamily N-acetyltransferase|nr:GNAT family N-acetyltransferase [Treponema sp.]
MNIEIRQIKKNDFNTARKFAIDGMHLKWYASNRFELYFYSKYFWYFEILKASKALGAYMKNKLVGILLADMNNEPKIFRSVGYKLFTKIIGFIINIFYKNASNTYDKANMKMLEYFKREYNPDGEINFFAVDTNMNGRGIGTLLLNELKKQEKGKLVYLYTDSGSTYQFYIHRGFDESGRTDIKLEINEKEIGLTCYLFSKRL